MVHSTIKNNYSKSYSKDHCYQYEIRLQNFKSDLKQAKLTKVEVNSLKVSDFEFRYVPKDDAGSCQEIKNFIIRHEWLGKMPHRPTHRFIATYKNQLAGVIVMATPNTFSNLLGSENRDKEKLISRGACISWSPKNLGSALVMFSIRWMVKNTNFRFFTAYSDTEARELGTIYQACNFIYLSQNSGARYEYLDPSDSKRGYFSDRLFRKTSSYKRYAAALEICWHKSWSSRDKIFWQKIPNEIALKLKEASKIHQARCKRRSLPKKHKYLYIKGKSKAETKKLSKLFRELNPNRVNLSYPKERVPLLRGRQSLTERPPACWPSKMEDTTPTKKLYSIKEVSKMYGLSLYLIYQHIRTDPTFPFVNVGMKKRYLIDLTKLDEWLQRRSFKQNSTEQYLPTAHELLEVTA